MTSKTPIKCLIECFKVICSGFMGMPYMELPYRYLTHCIPLQMRIIFVGGGAFLLWEKDSCGRKRAAT